jgi:hypothetical protein
MHGGGGDPAALTDATDFVGLLGIPEGGVYENFYGFSNSARKWCNLNANLVVLLGAAFVTRVIAENPDAGPVCRALVDMLLLAKERKAPVAALALRKALKGCVEGGMAYWGRVARPVRHFSCPVGSPCERVFDLSRAVRSGI